MDVPEAAEDIAIPVKVRAACRATGIAAVLIVTVIVVAIHVTVAGRSQLPHLPHFQHPPLLLAEFADNSRARRCRSAAETRGTSAASKPLRIASPPGFRIAHPIGRQIGDPCRADVRHNQIGQIAQANASAEPTSKTDLDSRAPEIFARDRNRLRIVVVREDRARSQFDAASARIPEPVPTSTTVMPGFRWRSMASRQSRVVSCAPVPNARPGIHLDADAAGRRRVVAPSGTDEDALADLHRLQVLARERHPVARVGRL